MDWLTFLSSIFAAALTGTAASLFAPWSQWGVEKRKASYRDKREMIKSWYKIANDYSGGRCEDIIDHKNYLRLRAYLSQDAIKLFEVRDRTITLNVDVSKIKSGASNDQVLQVLLEEIKRIQKKWKLI